MPRRKVCFVTGTRAEFGLMQSTLRAIQADKRLHLQLIVTGMHLDRSHGRTIDQIRRDGWKIDAVVPWKPAGDDKAELARQTGLATAKLAQALSKLDPDIVLVVGDRVEAFAAATAAHLSGKILAHIHGGDRALGQVDDALRHAITKLAHFHFPATQQSADRIAKLGEDIWRIKCVGSPGLDGIRNARLAGHDTHRYALLLLHPTEANDAAENTRAKVLLAATQSVDFDRIIIVYPNNDPGAAGIVEAWKTVRKEPNLIIFPDLPRNIFLGLMRSAAALIGNSSSGIIEAASFGTPVIDIGSRQAGRQRGENVTTVPFRQAAIRKALADIWNDGSPRRYRPFNIYGRGNASKRIAATLASLKITPKLRQKLIAY